MPHRRVAADDDVVLGQVQGVVGPLLDPDHGEVRAVADEDRDDLGEAGGALVLEDDDRLGVPADGDDEAAPDPLGVAAHLADPDRLGQHGVGGDVQVHGTVGVRDGQRGGAVGRSRDAQRAGLLGR